MTAPAAPPNHAAALAQYRRRAPYYDFELAAFEPIRRAAIARLALHSGDAVLDVGCGTGLSLAALRAAVGATGRVVGIEQCPEMLARARRVVRAHRWRNVVLVEAAAEDAVFAPPAADAALFHFTHDILRAPAALAAVARGLRPGARVVASGLQWAPSAAGPWAWPVNLFVLGAALHSVSSLAGLEQPWRLLARTLDHLQVEALLAGGVFVVSGTLRGGPDHPAPHAS